MDIVTNAMPCVLPLDARGVDGAHQGPPGLRAAEDLRADLRGDRHPAGRPRHRRRGQRVHARHADRRAAAAAAAALDAASTRAAPSRRAEEKRYATPRSPRAAYTFALAGTGDADLYVKRGAAPTTSSYDCRPYKSGSAETCTVTLAAARRSERHGARLRSVVDVQAHRQTLSDLRELVSCESHDLSDP